ncbi:exportin-4 protein [Arabidopsis thaliana]|uniref:Exportin-4 n=1 Tax=Arabidopsis thaliana TaxID=3702 RepID=B3H6P6_ARATH|nr:exportin-4 protein [Arabidopsis thaliana]AEE86877.1 exportin-4 protein [Arabidopsis thaliana]|eukprot:NP_001119136.1 exportin-4 protein [Arabidopsis thaliana]
MYIQKYEVSLLIKGLSWSLFVLTSCVLDISLSFVQINSNPVAAEATILSLHQSPQPYKACRYILENSQVANARFQAAAAIRKSAIREWSFLATDDKGGLISFCLGYVMQHANSSEGYVLSKVSSVAAQLA